MNIKRNVLYLSVALSLLSLLWGCGGKGEKQAEQLPVQCRVESAPDLAALHAGFMTPPEEARPWVYWFIMDGNFSKEGITADLEAMKRVGIGGAIFLEVNVGIPKGNVDFMTPQWIENFRFATQEAERLGIQLTLISGPGWTGSGGPWVKPEDAMHFIVTDTISVTGGTKVSVVLPRPHPKEPYFGIRNLTEEMQKQRDEYYVDLFALAYPKPKSSLATIPEIDEKALYVRHPYSSRPHTKPYVDEPTRGAVALPDEVLSLEGCIDVSAFVNADGVLEWDAPAGEWIIYRFGKTLTGANTRPAPLAGVGFECSKMDTTAFNHHLDQFVGTLAKAVDLKPGERKVGWNMLHIDSWEMGPQNWSNDFREQFQQRRGYDPLPYLATLSGSVVQSRELSERFLWDLRKTSTELILENHAEHLKRVAHRYGMGLSIEPYDMSPNNDIALGSVADVPMCEFWEKSDLFNTTFSCIEAVSAAHINNRPIVGAEAFTSGGATRNPDTTSWRLNPSNMKEQADWAFCTGVNRFVFHRYAHQPWLDRFPGMTMGPYGAHYERTQTWWELSQAWHTYLSRNQYMLRQGRPVVDILYLTPEGAPHAFTPPVSALGGSEKLPDKKGYGFDGCDPGTLLTKASVKNGKIVFPGGVEYSLLVLPTMETMTPELLARIEEMMREGATVLGYAPQKSPSLAGYPESDVRVAELSKSIWGELLNAPAGGSRTIGKGALYAPTSEDSVGLGIYREFVPHYVKYEAAERTLRAMNILPDFESAQPMRYIHRFSNGMDIYLVSNPTARAVEAECLFRLSGKRATLWSAVDGRTVPAEVTASQDGRSRLTLPLEAHGAVFVVFSNDPNDAKITNAATLQPQLKDPFEVKGPWTVRFQEKRGAPAEATFAELMDWSRHSDPRIRYFSGIAEYENRFQISSEQWAKGQRWYIDLGRTAVMARVTINGKPVTELWRAPYRCEITPFVQEGENTLVVSVANEWPNRMAGDQRLPEKERITFSTMNKFTKDFELLPSGLMGPVRVGAEPK